MAKMVKVDTLIYSLDNLAKSDIGKRKALEELKRQIISNAVDVPDNEIATDTNVGDKI